MGGNSTSQSALLRDESKTRPVYDLRSWQGLTDVLRAAKQNLTPEKHAAFRDLVLRYAQQGGDAALKSEIDAVIAVLHTPHTASLGAAHASQSQTLSRASASNRMGRPVPQFAVRQSTPQPVPRPAPKPVPSPIPVPELTPEPVPASVITHTPPPKPVSPPPAPVPEQKLESVPVPVFEPPIPAPKPVTPLAPVAPKEEFSGTPRSLDEHKARIIEIKRLVNEQIGNPVALVGAHKALGREYMQALLTALKATGGGGVGADAAMRRLEDAYTALFTDAPETPATPSAPVPPPAPEPVIESAPVVEVKQEVVPPPNPVPQAVPSPTAPVFEPPAPKPIEIPRPEPVKEVAPPESIDVPLPVVPKPEPKPIPSPTAPRVVVPKPEPVRPAPVVPPPAPPLPRSDVVASKPSAPAPVPQASKERIPSAGTLSPAARLAELTKNAQPAPKAEPVPQVDVPTPKPAPAATAFQQTKFTQKKVGSVSIQALAASGIDTEEHEVRQSELASPKITKALHELLDEWSIFNASGFLGMGPSGAEHPLYIRLAPLSMGEILTGRYEGADRKVNTVVHDYVNAWRHEQGIAYTPSETFEHYLRRVVQRIQKRQGAPA